MKNYLFGIIVFIGLGTGLLHAAPAVRQVSGPVTEAPVMVIKSPCVVYLPVQYGFSKTPVLHIVNMRQVQYMYLDGKQITVRTGNANISTPSSEAVAVTEQLFHNLGSKMAACANLNEKDN